MITPCLIHTLRSIPSFYSNIINFFGTNRQFDAEAEFRLAQLGMLIVEAKSLSLDVSRSLKASYIANIQNLTSQHDHLTNTLDHLTSAQEAWVNVTESFRDNHTWLNGKLRDDYSNAFLEAATVDNLHSVLVNHGLSNQYTASAFERIRSICEESEDAAQSILDCFEHLAELVERCTEIIIEFRQHLSQLQAEGNFALYDHIFNSLAVDGEKPRLYELDEIYFAAQNEFEIVYEVVEQIARDAHTRVPGTHGETPQYFNSNTD